MTPNDFGKNITVEDCRRFPIRGLVESFKEKTKEAILNAKVMVNRQCVRLDATPLHFGGFRFWFLCPRCSHRIAVLLANPLTEEVGCRACLGVEYRAKRFKGMVELEAM
jgi:hypothetical protein